MTFNIFWSCLKKRTRTFVSEMVKRSYNIVPGLSIDGPGSTTTAYERLFNRAWRMHDAFKNNAFKNKEDSLPSSFHATSRATDWCGRLWFVVGSASLPSECEWYASSAALVDSPLVAICFLPPIPIWLMLCISCSIGGLALPTRQTT
jgi:hypothetical protein